MSGFLVGKSAVVNTNTNEIRNRNTTQYQYQYQLLGQLSGTNERGCKKGNDLTLGSDECDDNDDGERDQMIFSGFSFYSKMRIVMMIHEKRKKGSRCEIQLITTETTDEVKRVRNQNNS